MIPQDKAMHFTVGFALSLLISILSAGFHLFTQPTLGWICLGAATFVGLAKECFDKFYQKEKFDIWDWVATALGGVLFFFA
jgi:hypothetical protein